MELIIRKGIPIDLKVNLDSEMSEDEFSDFCAKKPDLFLERDKGGNIIVMEPVFVESGHYDSVANGELHNWNKQSKTGIVFSSNAGFTLPDGAVRSPDAAWISSERFAALPREEHDKFAHICPDFVLEIRSRSDTLKEVRKKMHEYMENGALLGFLIDPKTQQGFIYRPGGLVENLKGPDAVLPGEPLLPGFRLPLSLFQMP